MFRFVMLKLQVVQLRVTRLHFSAYLFQVNYQPPSSAKYLNYYKDWRARLNTAQM